MRAVSIAVAASFWIATACPVQAAPAQSTPFAARRNTDSTFQQLAKRYNAAIAVGVIRNHRLVWTGYYGEQSSGVPVTQKTMFNVASLAKPITAEAILRLASEGRIVLDEPMSRYWVDPDVFADPRHKLLTPEIALSHRTGFRNWRYME